MADVHWLAMAVVTMLAIQLTVFFGVRHLRTPSMRSEWQAGYARGRAEVKLENLERGLRDINAKLDAQGTKLENLGPTPS